VNNTYARAHGRLSASMAANVAFCPSAPVATAGCPGAFRWWHTEGMSGTPALTKMSAVVSSGQYAFHREAAVQVNRCRAKRRRVRRPGAVVLTPLLSFKRHERFFSAAARRRPKVGQQRTQLRRQNQR